MDETGIRERPFGPKDDPAASEEGGGEEGEDKKDVEEVKEEVSRGWPLHVLVLGQRKWFADACGVGDCTMMINRL